MFLPSLGFSILIYKLGIAIYDSEFADLVLWV